MVNSDFPLEDKKKALIGLIQRGIDQYGMFENGKSRGELPVGSRWRAQFRPQIFNHVCGSHARGFEDERRGAGDTVHRYGRTWAVSGEDVMTFYVDQKHIDVTNSPAWKPAYGDKNPQQPYSQAMLGMPDWKGGVSMENTSASWTGHPYRLSPNTGSQSGRRWRRWSWTRPHGATTPISITTRVSWKSWRADRPLGNAPGPELSYPPVAASVNPERLAKLAEELEDVRVWEMIQNHWHEYYQYPRQAKE